MQARGDNPASVAVLLEQIRAELDRLERVVATETQFTSPHLEGRLGLVRTQLRALSREIGQRKQLREPHERTIPAVRDRSWIALKVAMNAYRTAVETDLPEHASDVAGPHKKQGSDGYVSPDCPEQDWKE